MKTTLDCFTPQSQRLAVVSHSYMRVSLAIDCAFPAVLDRDDQVLKAIDNAAYGSKLFERKVTAIAKNDHKQAQLMEYVRCFSESWL